MSTHRRDIDGLRAIAVVGVLLHHYQVPYFLSGFVGVDIFFVISGFLVGGIVLESLAKRHFSFGEFYKRRIYRIAPALIVMLLISTMAAYFLLMPHEFRYYGGGVISTLLSVANVWFYNRINYFNPEVGQEPLIHTWSLGVEEQFYLFLPILLLFAFKFLKHKVGIFLIAVAGISYLAMLYKANTNADAAFYLPFFRLWELLAGVLAFRYKDTILGFAKSYANVLVGSATLGLLCSLVFLDSAVWPSAMALIPVLCTCIVLVFGEAANRSSLVLNNSLAVFIGTISYSLYLYHQPILAFSKMIDVVQSGWAYWGGLASITLTASVLSWKYIEQPFRCKSTSVIANKITLIYLPLLLISFSLISNYYKGFPSRFSVEVQTVLSYEKSFSTTYEKCLPDRKLAGTVKVEQGCVHGAPVNPSVAIWGDSYAAILANPLGNILKDRGLAVKELTMSACAPIVGLYRENLNHGENCIQWNEAVIDYLLRTRSIRTVVIQSNWIQNLDEPWLMRPSKGWESVQTTGKSYKELVGEVLSRQIGRLIDGGKRVVLVYPIPSANEFVPRAYARKMLQNKQVDPNISQPYADFVARSKNTAEILISMPDRQNFEMIYVVDSLCNVEQNQCLIVENGVPLYFDGSHLSLPGVSKIVGPIANRINP